jgi:hypothetical protein
MSSINITCSCIRLILNEESVIIKKNKDNSKYELATVKQWIFLTIFNKAQLITKIPNDVIETTVDKKFVYNQDYILMDDIDFNFRYIYPLGNMVDTSYYPYQSIPFTGSIDGNNYSIKNINITNCMYNGLIGVGICCKIKNLTIENIIINEGTYNGGLFGKAFNVMIDCIKIIGNIMLTGSNCACLASIMEGECKNLHICIDGMITGDQSSALLINNFNGMLEYCTIISNIEIICGYFNTVNGKIKNSNIISFHYIEKPFYDTTKYHIINKCHYLQLNSNDLPPMQRLISCFYKNFNTTIYSDPSDSLIEMIEGITHYIDSDMIPKHLKNKNTNTKFYNYITGKHNISSYYIDMNKNFTCKGMNRFDKEKLLFHCDLMKEQFIKEKDRINTYKEEQNNSMLQRIANTISKISRTVVPNKVENKPNIEIQMEELNIESDSEVEDSIISEKMEEIEDLKDNEDDVNIKDNEEERREDNQEDVEVKANILSNIVDQVEMEVEVKVNILSNIVEDELERREDNEKVEADAEVEMDEENANIIPNIVEEDNEFVSNPLFSDSKNENKVDINLNIEEESLVIIP